MDYRHNSKGRLYLSARRRKNKGENFRKRRMQAQQQQHEQLGAPGSSNVVKQEIMDDFEYEEHPPDPYLLAIELLEHTRNEQPGHVFPNAPHGGQSPLKNSPINWEESASNLKEVKEILRNISEKYEEQLDVQKKQIQQYKEQLEMQKRQHEEHLEMQKMQVRQYEEQLEVQKKQVRQYEEQLEVQKKQVQLQERMLNIMEKVTQQNGSGGAISQGK